MIWKLRSRSCAPNLRRLERRFEVEPKSVVDRGIIRQRLLALAPARPVDRGNAVDEVFARDVSRNPYITGLNHGLGLAPVQVDQPRSGRRRDRVAGFCDRTPMRQPGFAPDDDGGGLAPQCARTVGVRYRVRNISRLISLTYFRRS